MIAIALFLSFATLLAGILVGAIVGILVVKMIGAGFDMARPRHWRARR